MLTKVSLIIFTLLGQVIPILGQTGTLQHTDYSRSGFSYSLSQDRYGNWDVIVTLKDHPSVPECRWVGVNNIIGEPNVELVALLPGKAELDEDQMYSVKEYPSRDSKSAYWRSLKNQKRENFSESPFTRQVQQVGFQHGNGLVPIEIVIANNRTPHYSGKEKEALLKTLDKAGYSLAMVNTPPMESELEYGAVRYRFKVKDNLAAPAGFLLVVNTCNVLKQYNPKPLLILWPESNTSPTTTTQANTKQANNPSQIQETQKETKTKEPEKPKSNTKPKEKTQEDPQTNHEPQVSIQEEPTAIAKKEEKTEVPANKPKTQQPSPSNHSKVESEEPPSKSKNNPSIAPNTLEAVMGAFHRSIQNNDVETFLAFLPKDGLVNIQFHSPNLTPAISSSKGTGGTENEHASGGEQINLTQIKENSNGGLAQALFSEYSGTEWGLKTSGKYQYVVKVGPVHSLKTAIEGKSVTAWQQVDPYTYSMVTSPGKDTVTIKWKEDGDGYVINEIHNLMLWNQQ